MGALKQDFRIRCANFGFQLGADHDVCSEVLSYSKLHDEPGSFEWMHIHGDSAGMVANLWQKSQR
jgi:hypothetical protein